MPSPFADFFGGKGKQAKRAPKYSTDTTHLPLLQSVHPPAGKLISLPAFPFLPSLAAQRQDRPPPGGVSPLDPPASRRLLERRSGLSGVGWALVLLVSWLAFLVGILGGLFLCSVERFLFSGRSKSLVPPLPHSVPIQFAVEFGAARAPSVVRLGSSASSSAFKIGSR